MPHALNPEKRAQARLLRSERKSLNEIARALGISYGSAYRYTTGVCPEKERPSELRAKIAASRQPAHVEWKRTVPRGGCETPGCDRLDCPVPYGKCHCGCDEYAPRAPGDDRRQRYVRGEPRRYVQGHQRGGDTLMAADDAGQLLNALERVGMTRIEVSRRAKLGKGVVADLIGLKGYRLRRARCERIVSVLREEFERQGLDPSELTVERLFTEKRPADEPPVGARARRVTRRRPPSPPSERGDGRHFRIAAEQLREECERRGVWTHERAAAELGLERSTLSYLRERRRLPSDELRVGPLTARVYLPQDIKRLGVELRQSEAAWDRRRRDPLAIQAWALTHGASPAEAGERAERAAERLKRLARIRVGTGRPKSSGPPAYHYEWRAKFVELKTELELQHETYHVDGDPPPTNLGVALLVAEDDLAEHPERWEYDPRDLPAEASRRIWNAIKPLLSTVTETRPT